jgi:sarcosine oxidase subunit beta
MGVQVPVIPRKGHVLITEILPERLYRHKVQEIGYHKTLESSFAEETTDRRQFGVAFASEQKKAGNVLVGTCREFVGFDLSTNPAVGAAVARRGARFFPALANVRVLRVWTGLRPHTPDHLPIIGPAPGVEGFFIATGHEGLGTTLSPITGKLISEAVTGKTPTVQLEPLSLSRFDAAPLPSHFQEALAETARTGRMRP